MIYIGIMNHPDRPEPPWLPKLKTFFEHVIIYNEKHSTTREVLCALLKKILVTFEPKPKDYILICQDDIILGNQFEDALELLVPQLINQNVPMLQLFTYHIDLMSQNYGIHKTKPTSKEYYYLIVEDGDPRNVIPIIDQNYAAPNIYPRCYANLYTAGFALILLSQELEKDLPNADDMFVTKVMLKHKIPFHYVNPSFVYDTLLPRVQNDETFEDFKKHFTTKVSDLNHMPIKATKLIDRDNYFNPDINLRNLVLEWSSDEE